MNSTGVWLRPSLLGTIFAVMVVDYYLLRKQRVNVNDPYDKQGIFKSINWTDIIAIAVGSLCSLIVVDLSWYVSLIPSGLLYHILMKTLPQAESFHKSTIFER